MERPPLRRARHREQGPLGRSLGFLVQTHMLSGARGHSCSSNTVLPVASDGACCAHQGGRHWTTTVGFIPVHTLTCVQGRRASTGAPGEPPATNTPPMRFCATSHETRTGTPPNEETEVQRGTHWQGARAWPHVSNANVPSPQGLLRPVPSPDQTAALEGFHASCRVSQTLTSCPVGLDRSFNQSARSAQHPDTAGQMCPPGHLVGPLFLTWACVRSEQRQESGVQEMGKGAQWCQGLPGSRS